MDLLVTIDDLNTHISSQKVIQLADDDRDSVADTDVITQVSTTATALINDTLEPRYGSYVPFAYATCPPILKSLARDFATFELYARRNTVPDIIRYRYELALERLKEYATGRIPLVLPTQTLATTDSDDVVTSTAFTDRVFTRDTLYDFGKGCV